MTKELLQKSKEQLTRIAVVHGHDSDMYKAYAQAMVRCQKLHDDLREKKREVRRG